MAEARRQTVVTAVPQAQIDTMMDGRPKKGLVVAGSSPANNFGIVLLAGIQNTFKNPGGGTTTPDVSDRFGIYRQAAGERFGAAWELVNLDDSTPTAILPANQVSQWGAYGGGSALFTSVSAGTPFPTRAYNAYIWLWNDSAGAFSKAYTHRRGSGENFFFFRAETYFGWRRASDGTYRMWSWSDYVNASDEVVQLLSGTSTAQERGDSILFPEGTGNSDIGSSGDGFTVPTGRGNRDPILFQMMEPRLRGRGGQALRSQLMQIDNPSATPSFQQIGDGRVPARAFDLLADGSTLWMTYPTDPSTANGLSLLSAPQPSAPSSSTAFSEVTPRPHAFPHSSMTSSKILNIWLAEASGVGGSQRLCILVEFQREATNGFYQTYAGGAIQCPFFWLTGDYSNRNNISWNEDNWQPLIAPADQALFAQYRNNTITDRYASPFIGMTKHALDGAFHVAMAQYASRDIDVIRIGDFGIAPDRPVWRTPTQEAPAQLTAIRSPDTTSDYGGQYAADASHPLRLQWTYRSPEGGQQYAYRLRRTRQQTTITEYWTGSRWISELDEQSLILAGSIGGVANVTLPGSPAAGWGRDNTGALIEEPLEFRVQTFAEERGAASPFSGRLDIVPAEAQQPVIISPGGAYGSVSAAGARPAGSINANNAIPLPTTLDVSGLIDGAGQRLGWFRLHSFDQGEIIETLTDIDNLRIRADGTYDRSGRLELYSAASEPSQARSGQSPTATAATRPQGSVHRFALDYTWRGRTPRGTWIYLAHNQGSATNVNIESLTLTGSTGADSTLLSPRFGVHWIFPEHATDPQTRYLVKLFSGRRTSGFDTADTLDTVDVAGTEAASVRDIDVDILVEGTYTLSVQTQGRSPAVDAAGDPIPGLLSQPTYLIFEADLTDPTFPDTETVDIVTTSRNSDGDLVVSEVDLPSDRAALRYRAEFPQVVAPLQPGLGSAYGANGNVDAVWRAPWPNGSRITEWQFAIDSSRIVTLDAVLLADENCPRVTWDNVSNGNHRVQARCRNIAGWSPWSDNRFVTVGPVESPQPETVSVAPPAPLLEARHSGQVAVFMCDPANTGGSPIVERQGQWRRAGTGGWTSFAFGDGLNDRDEAVGPAPFNASDTIAYEFQVRVRNSTGWSPWSGSTQITPPATGSFRGATPDHAVILRRQAGSADEPIPIAEIDIEPDPDNPLRVLIEHLDWAPAEDIEYEYLADLYVTVATGTDAGAVLVRHRTDGASGGPLTSEKTRLVPLAAASSGTLSAADDLIILSVQNYSRSTKQAATNLVTSDGKTHVLVGAVEPTETPTLTAVNVPVATVRQLEALRGASVVVLDARFDPRAGVVRSIDEAGSTAMRGRADTVNIVMKIESDFPAIVPQARLRRQVHNIIGPGE